MSLARETSSKSMQSYQNFEQSIRSQMDTKRVFSDPVHTLAYGTDASLYRITPQIVLKPLNQKELMLCIKTALEFHLPFTIKAGGTSLSGQTLSESVLIALDWGFRNYEILEEGKAIRLEPGLRAEYVNELLAPLGKKIGPDPASLASAMIGGIVSNNASGMCCGITQNSYQTIKDAKLAFADGSVLDTADADSKASFQKTHQHLLKGLADIAQRIEKNQPLKEKIQRKYAIKNTTGYSLNAFVDFEDPFEILKHLIVGAEGTLAVLLEVILETVDEPTHKASALVIFDSVSTACLAAEKLNTIRSIVNAAELMDRSALRSAEDQPIAPSYFKTLPEGACALLVQTVSNQQDTLNQQIQTITQNLEGLNHLQPIEFTKDAKIYGNYWKIRKGIMPSLGQIRKLGTTYLIEDIAFPIESLNSGVEQLQDLFVKHRYNNGIVIGHVLDGNVHFVICQDFTIASEIERYEAFIKDVVAMTLKLNGSLKAEHSTGRNMAGFVEQEWGKEAYQLMKEVKALFDPDNLINPGVILNDDQKVHLKNFKEMPTTHDLIDKCIECGFCERVCPSQQLTFTPRQRIVINRYLEDFKAKYSPEAFKKLDAVYQYDGNATCATCGLCETVCPVSIDTGKLIKVLKKQRHSSTQHKIAKLIARNFSSVLFGAKVGLKTIDLVSSVIGKRNLKALTQKSHQHLGSPVFLQYTPSSRIQPFKTPKISASLHTQKVVYFPSCLSRLFAPTSYHQDQRTLPEVMHSLFEKANYEVVYPENTKSLCCGMAFSSKGFDEAASIKYQELEQALLVASNQGVYPICVDISPCTYTMLNTLDSRLNIYDAVKFARKFLLDKFQITKRQTKVALHNVCSGQKLGIGQDLRHIAQLCASEIVEPKEVTCCGFAGDKGFFNPELNEQALINLKGEVQTCQEGFSNSISCEIGLSEQSGIPYFSILYLLDRCSQAKNA